jgi:hypothetical protein
VVEGYPSNLDVVRSRIAETKDEIARVQRLPVPSDDLGERIAHYVARLAVRAQPVIRGIADGETLSVHWPLTDHANRVHLTGFAPDEASALLIAALLDGERLAERLTQSALAGSIPAAERSARLHELQQRLTTLHYDEEASVAAALERGEDVSRAGSQPPWSVLMIEVEHQQAAAA